MTHWLTSIGPTRERMETYFDPNVGKDEIRQIAPSLMDNDEQV